MRLTAPALKVSIQWLAVGANPMPRSTGPNATVVACTGMPIVACSPPAGRSKRMTPAGMLMQVGTRTTLTPGGTLGAPSRARAIWRVAEIGLCPHPRPTAKHRKQAPTKMHDLGDKKGALYGGDVGLGGFSAAHTVKPSHRATCTTAPGQPHRNFPCAPLKPLPSPHFPNGPRRLRCCCGPRRDRDQPGLCPPPNQVCAAVGWCERASDLLCTIPLTSANLHPRRPSSQFSSQSEFTLCRTRADLTDNV